MTDPEKNDPTTGTNPDWDAFAIFPLYVDELPLSPAVMRVYLALVCAVQRGEPSSWDDLRARCRVKPRVMDAAVDELVSMNLVRMGDDGEGRTFFDVLDLPEPQDEGDEA